MYERLSALTLCIQSFRTEFSVSCSVFGMMLDNGHKENIYQRAVARVLQDEEIAFQEQLPAKILFRGKPVGIYYFDFLIDDTVVLELKVRNYFSRKDIEQAYAYLKARNLKLGIIAHFTKDGVKYKRVVNIR